LLGVWLLSSCSLYHKVFHPYRLPTPKPSPEYIAQQKAKKEKEKGLLAFTHDKKKEKSVEGGPDVEAATDVSTPSGGTVTAPSQAPAARTLPEKSTVRYDKKGLMKKPKLKRRKVNKQHKPFRPWQSIRDFFKYGLHKKPDYEHGASPKAPKEESTPDAAPTGDKP
jgi:hypothetical protein